MTTISKIATLFKLIRVRLAKADRAELEQASLRVVVAAVIVGYVAWLESPKDSNSAVAVLLIWGFFGASLALLSTIWFWPAKSVVRRILGIVGDVSVATWGLWAMGEGGVAIVGIYLFIILGNGFRFGRMYLHITQILSLMGLTFAMVKAPWWQDHLGIGVGLLEILLIIPFYVGVLAERLRSALENTQRALEQCRREGSERRAKPSAVDASPPAAATRLARAAGSRPQERQQLLMMLDVRRLSTSDFEMTAIDPHTGFHSRRKLPFNT